MDTLLGKMVYNNILSIKVSVKKGAAHKNGDIYGKCKWSLVIADHIWTQD